jgi:hypothetical protein
MNTTRPRTKQGVIFKPALRSERLKSYGIDRWFQGENLEDVLVEDFLTKEQAEWMCEVLNANP